MRRPAGSVFLSITVHQSRLVSRTKETVVIGSIRQATIVGVRIDDRVFGSRFR
jgi:hypothetical protein